MVSYEGYGHHKATLFFWLPVQNYFYKAMDQAGAYHSNKRIGELVNNSSLWNWRQKAKDLKAVDAVERANAAS